MIQWVFSKETLRQGTCAMEKNISALARFSSSIWRQGNPL
jgi:hypothetical protein